MRRAIIALLLSPGALCACSQNSMNVTGCYLYEIATVTKDAETETVEKGEFWKDDALSILLTGLRPQEGDTTVIEFREMEGIRFPSTDPRYPLVWRETPHVGALVIHNQGPMPVDLVWGNTVFMDDGHVVTKGNQHVMGQCPEGTPVLRLPPSSFRTLPVPDPGLLLPNWSLTFSDLPLETHMEDHKERLQLIREELARLPLQRFSMYLEVLVGDEVHDYTIIFRPKEIYLGVEGAEGGCKDCVPLDDYDPETLLGSPRPSAAPYAPSRRRSR